MAPTGWISVKIFIGDLQNCQEILNLVKMWQKYKALYMKT